MKHFYLPLAFGLLIGCAMPAQAAGCYADYKAKQDNPLRLHYGVAELREECSVSAAEAELPERLAADDWQLLNVLGTFDDTGLEERKESAGEFFLRY